VNVEQVGAVMALAREHGCRSVTVDGVTVVMFPPRRTKRGPRPPAPAAAAPPASMLPPELVASLYDAEPEITPDEERDVQEFRAWQRGETKG
jgi:hypothetical protein